MVEDPALAHRYHDIGGGDCRGYPIGYLGDRRHVTKAHDDSLGTRGARVVGDQVRQLGIAGVVGDDEDLLPGSDPCAIAHRDLCDVGDVLTVM